MKTILVPTDFSEHANYALDLARQLAIRHGMEIRLMHVVEQPAAPYMTAVTSGMHDQLGNVYMLRFIEKVKAQLEVITTELDKEGVPSTYQIKIGNPYRNISTEIKKEPCDLIIMGTHGTSGIDEMLVGSNTEKVVRYAHCPVITLKAPVKVDSIKNVVFAASYFENGENLVLELKNLQRLFDAKIHLLTINTPSNFQSERDGMNRLVRFAQKHHLQDYTVNMYNDFMEEEGIRHFAEDREADMIVMATHGRTGISHLLAGSISEKLVNKAILPVVTFPLKSHKTNPVKDIVL